MGTIFEELVRRFNEENNEEAGEHWTPRDAVTLMAKLVFVPVADRIDSGTLPGVRRHLRHRRHVTVAEKTLQELARAHGKQVAAHLYGQEINSETYAYRQGGPPPQGGGRSRRQHRRGAGTLDALQRRLSVPRVRLHALQPALRQELEERSRAYGRQEGHARPALS